MKILCIADEELNAFWDHYVPGRLREYDLILSSGDLKAAYLSFIVTIRILNSSIKCATSAQVASVQNLRVKTDKDTSCFAAVRAVFPLVRTKSRRNLTA